jgi:hypothetical protein
MIRVRRLDKPKFGEKLNDLNLEISNLTTDRLKTSLRNPEPIAMAVIERNEAYNDAEPWITGNK